MYFYLFRSPLIWISTVYVLQSSAKYRRGNFAEIARRYLIFFPLSDDI